MILCYTISPLTLQFHIIFLQDTTRGEMVLWVFYNVNTSQVFSHYRFLPNFLLDTILLMSTLENAFST